MPDRPAGTASPWVAEGPPDAPVIVFVHGAIVSRAVWGPEVALLRDRYRCVSVDLPGHGTLEGQRFTLDAAADVVAGAIDAAGGGRALVVGLSLGGYVAMTLAARDPERVRGLVIADASLEPVGLGGLAFLAYGWLLRLLPKWLVREVGVGLFRRVYGRRMGDRLADGYDSKAGGQGVLTLPGQRFRARLRAYGGPILVINGSLDLVFVAGERAFVRGLPGLTVRRLHGASHMSNLDRPEAFSAAVSDFEATLPA
ncbi:MAG TPA: alpha/beta hydrolase [Candidatus Acidoferrales bacterium]|nr:alpha/beta hydrolase [Candidatus Acidoferrales bacterium]